MNNEYRQALCDWLSGYPIDTFFTITSAHKEQSAIRMLSHVCKWLEPRVSRGFAAAEPHPGGHGVHIHGIATLLPDEPGKRAYSHQELQDLYTGLFGWSRFERVQSGFVTKYCTKYAAKSGDWDIVGDWRMC